MPIFFCFIISLLLSAQAISAERDDVELLDTSQRPPLAMTSQEYEGSGLIAEQVRAVPAPLDAEAEPLDLLAPPAPAIVSVQHMENWLDTEVINKKNPLSKCMNGGLLVFGYSSAFARGSVYFILGYKLSEHFFVASVSSPGNHILSTIYASAASIPMTLLGAASSQKFLKYLVTPTPQNFINIKKEEHCFKKSLRITGNIILLGAAACSASILTYIAYDNYSPLIGWFWLAPGLPTFYVRTLIDFYAMKQLGGGAYDKLISGPKNKKLYLSQPESRGAAVHEIQDLLSKSRSFVSSLNYKQAKVLEDILKNPGENVDQKVRAFTKPEFFVRDDVNIIRSSWFREAVGYIGGAVAVCGMYLYYNGTKAAFGFTQPSFYTPPSTGNYTLSPPDEANYTQASFAIFSLATASSLSAIAAHSSAQKFYDLVSNVVTRSYKKIFSFCGGRVDEGPPIAPLPRTREDTALMLKRAGVASLAFLLASCDAGTLYELAVQQSLSMHDFKNVLALVSSSVALFSMSFWAVDEALMYYVRGGDPKTTVLTLIDQVDSTLSSMSDSAVKALRHILRINHAMPLGDL